jgi:ATP-dependent DNA ligase
MPTISYTYPDGFEVYSPQLVGKPFKNYEQTLKTNKWIGSVKKDGYWESIYKINGNVYMFARNVSKKTGLPTEKINHVPHIKEWAEKYLPNNSIIVAEIYLPNGTSKDVTTILGCLQPEAVTRQEQNEKLHLWIHDILMWNGYNYVEKKDSYAQRYADLEKYISSICTDEIELATFYDSADTDLLAKAEELIADGEEGMVIRAKDQPYNPGTRRPKEMFKIKKEITSDVDLVITALLDPTYYYEGKEADTWPFKDEKGNLITKAAFYGWKNALEVSAYDTNGNLVKIGQVASGLTDIMREDMAKNPHNYIGNVVQVKAMSWTDDGALRHPIFIQMRPDKDASECKLEELR